MTSDRRFWVIWENGTARTVEAEDMSGALAVAQRSGLVLSIALAKGELYRPLKGTALGAS